PRLPSGAEATAPSLSTPSAQDGAALRSGFTPSEWRASGDASALTTLIYVEDAGWRGASTLPSERQRSSRIVVNRPPVRRWPIPASQAPHGLCIHRTPSSTVLRETDSSSTP